MALISMEEVRVCIKSLRKILINATVTVVIDGASYEVGVREDPSLLKEAEQTRRFGVEDGSKYSDSPASVASDEEVAEGVRGDIEWNRILLFLRS